MAKWKIQLVWYWSFTYFTVEFPLQWNFTVEFPGHGFLGLKYQLLNLHSSIMDFPHDLLLSLAVMTWHLNQATGNAWRAVVKGLQATCWSNLPKNYQLLKKHVNNGSQPWHVVIFWEVEGCWRKCHRKRFVYNFPDTNPVTIRGFDMATWQPWQNSFDDLHIVAISMANCKKTKSYWQLTATTITNDPIDVDLQLVKSGKPSASTITSWIFFVDMLILETSLNQS